VQKALISKETLATTEPIGSASFVGQVRSVHLEQRREGHERNIPVNLELGEGANDISKA
jgi:hypothetical protein